MSSLALIAWLLVAWVDQRLASRQYANVYDGCLKVWATRGLVVNRSPHDSRAGNNIESLTRAFEAGAVGSEIDVYFDSALDRFVVSHDRPYVTQNGRLLYLHELFEHFGDRYYWWLDFKNLRRLSTEEVHQAVNRLAGISQKGRLPSRIYIEGADPINLSVFRDQGFQTILDVHPLPESYPLTRAAFGLFKLVYYFGDFTVMAMNSGTADEPIFGWAARDSLRNVPLFLYHAPGEAPFLINLVRETNVRVVLAGDHRLNRYRLNACSRPQQARGR